MCTIAGSTWWLSSLSRPSGTDGQHTLFLEGDPQILFCTDETVSGTRLVLDTAAHSCAAMVGQEATWSRGMDGTVEHGAWSMEHGAWSIEHRA